MKRKILSAVLVLIFILTMLPSTIYAEDEYYAQYSGSTQASWGYNPNCTFTVNKIVNGKFTGRFAASNLGSYSFDEDISGSVYTSGDTFTCLFTVYFYNNRYYSNMVITVHPFEGYCDCFCVGSWHMEDFTMYGTVFNFGGNQGIFDSDYYDEDDMKMCMDLSEAIYEEKKGATSKDRLKERIKQYNEKEQNTINGVTISRSDNNLKFYNLLDYNSENSPFAITIREYDNENKVDMIVIIRGTYKDEWQGNTEITGTSYDSNKPTHYSFEEAKKSLRTPIELYYRNLMEHYNYDEINLIITGHSRGAAVANLYAKDATDAMNTTQDMGTPRFNKVVAYTFACPNVAKYTSDMENYNNIFNFCIKEDLIPTVPLTPPASGWNYWRYGLTYYCPISLYDTSFIQSNDFELRANTVRDIHNCLTPWRSVWMYYNWPLYGGTNVTTLYNVAHDATGLIMSKSEMRNCLSFGNIVKRLGIYGDLTPLVITGAIHANSIASAHRPETYNYLIQHMGSSNFYYYTYANCIADNYRYGSNTVRNINSLRNNTVTYNSDEIAILTYLYNRNSDLLDWDITDQSTWTGITWNSSGNVTAIELPYLDLEGTLDLSNFSALESVNLAGNNLTSINLTDCDSLINLNISANNLTLLDVSDCTDLEALDCSFNDLSNVGLDVSANTALTSLTCDDCGLTTLNVNALTALEELSCAFNELTTINVDNNTALTSLTCCYNYMDTHEGGALYNKFDDLLFSDVYVNYYPQAVPDNAAFNSSELNALKTFAVTENNNDALHWLDENDNIDTDKLQNNVLFEYDGSAYRVVAVDIADTEVGGTLNLTELTKLKELYCENTSVSSLNVNSCTVLNTLSCDNCEITSLTLPSNATAKKTPLYDVSCEYNYIDTSIFTDTMVDYITFKAGAKLEYENQKGDNSALVAVMEFSNTLNSNDYSESTFSIFSEIIEDYENYENLLLTQTDIDEIVTEILTSINSLEPYLDLDISAPHGTFTVTYDNEPKSGITHSLLFGTPVTLTATADEGYAFDGWYENVTQRKFSSNSSYTFKITTNMDLEARFIRTGDVTLTFTNDTGQVVAKIDKSISEWSEVISIVDLLPEVPYKLGHTNGRWNYTEADVLTALQAGNDVTITPIYDDSTYEYPTVPTPTDNVPVINLYYSLDADNNVGSFTMAAGIPQELNIEAIGIGFYYKKAASFNPSNFILNINNKMQTSRFDNTDSDGIYIVNINKFTSTYNWCARGYITYYDENNELKTVYSNQINIVNREQT